jgi:hypothetical protein
LPALNLIAAISAACARRWEGILEVAKAAWWERRRILKLSTKSKKPRSQPTAEEITSLSADTLKRKYADRIKHLADKRVGMSLGDALDIAEGK